MIKNSIPTRGDIVLCDFSPTSGHEQSGLRPALVLSGQELIHLTKVITVCPITSTVRGHYFELNVNTKRTKGVAMIHQIRSIDFVSRQIKIVDKVSLETVKLGVEKVRVLIEG
jgi:mRNA interferase MazF